MKKALAMVLVVTIPLLMACAFAVCGKIEPQAAGDTNPRFVVVEDLDDGCSPIISGHGSVIYLVDTTTKVVYCEIMATRQVFPVLQSDGTPLLYEGDLQSLG